RRGASAGRLKAGVLRLRGGLAVPPRDPQEERARDQARADARADGGELERAVDGEPRCSERQHETDLPEPDQVAGAPEADRGDAANRVVGDQQQRRCGRADGERELLVEPEEEKAEGGGARVRAPREADGDRPGDSDRRGGRAAVASRSPAASPAAAPPPAGLTSSETRRTARNPPGSRAPSTQSHSPEGASPNPSSNRPGGSVSARSRSASHAIPATAKIA